MTKKCLCKVALVISARVAAETARGWRGSVMTTASAGGNSRPAISSTAAYRGTAPVHKKKCGAPAKFSCQNLRSSCAPAGLCVPSRYKAGRSGKPFKPAWLSHARCDTTSDGFIVDRKVTLAEKTRSRSCSERVLESGSSPASGRLHGDQYSFP